MNDNILLFEMSHNNKIFNIRIAKPWYKMWFIDTEPEEGKSDVIVYQPAGFNFVRTTNAHGFQLIIWGLSIIFAWSRGQNA
jgi:hypothetical protein